VLTILLIQRAQDVPFNHGQTQRLDHLPENLIQITQRNIEIAPDRSVKTE
jgi:hypothetical protein